MILGVAPGRSSTTVAVVRHGVLAWWRAYDGALLPARDGESLPASARASAGSLGNGPAEADLGEVRAACVAVDLDDVRAAPVAAIRVGGPCPPALGPQVTHPRGLATIVRGGHSLTRRPLAPLDAAAVRAFAAGCGLADFAVTATGSPVLADHELAVAELIAAEVPGARITLSYEFGRPGLRERERQAMLNAALRPEAERLADAAASWLEGIPLYFARSGEGLVSAHYFRRYPLICREGATAAALHGAHALPGPHSGRAVSPGPMGKTEAAPTGPADRGRGSVAVSPGSVAGAGEGGGFPPDVVAAFGAALAGPLAEVERIVQARGRAELDRALADARDEALTRVVSAGAAPGSARIGEVTVNPLSYLPDGLYRVRVTAAGTTP
ncbi:hypothetical protein [Nonomuraea dietziae]|uniref:Uncharacterized protein n=1 Tax=Nonomuraea dietziae TaxID=65515 RepID=A0A7W5VKR8_9ACTN|nr:hypothetical protein [Nonomuraea dietziae]MBB3733180.1 hypothetical protein [Nonomuraea dietziae]